jgi:hypothetical protein
MSQSIPAELHRSYAVSPTSEAAGRPLLDSSSSRRAVWTGRVLSGTAVLFLTFDAAVKVLKLPYLGLALGRAVAADRRVRVLLSAAGGQ